MATKTIEKAYGELSIDYFYSSGAKTNWVNSDYPINSGAFNVGKYFRSCSRTSFEMPTFSNYYESNYIIIKARAENLTATPSKCIGYLTDQALSFSEATNGKWDYYLYYGANEKLKNAAFDSSSAYIDESCTTKVTGEVAAGGNFYYKFNTDNLKPGTRYYMYFLNPSTNTSTTNSDTCGGVYAHIDQVIFNYSTIDTINNPSITTGDSQIFIPNTSITINWTASSSGDNNTLQGYYLYWHIGGAPTTSTYTGVSSLLTGTSYQFTISNATRGSSIYVGVQAIGSAGSSYNSSLVTKQIGVINSLPGAPTVTQSGTTVSAKTSISFTVSAGSDNNSSQTKTIYYQIGSGSKKVFTSPLTISISNASSYGITKTGSYTIKFYTYDGLEHTASSSAVSKTFTVILEPKLINPEITYTYVKNGNDQSTLTTKAVISFSLEVSTTVTANLYVRTATTSAGLGSATETSLGAYEVNNSVNPKTITIDLLSFLTYYIPYGNYFQFSFEVNDGIATSSRSDWLTSGQRPGLPGVATFSSVVTDAIDTSRTTTGYFKQNLEVTFNTPTITEAQVKLYTATIEAISKGATVGKNSVTVTGNKTYTITLSCSTALEDTEISLRIILTDNAGQSGSYVSYGSYYKAGKCSFITSNFNINPTTLKPLSQSQPINMVHPIASAKGTESIAYSYEILSPSIITLDQQEMEITENEADFSIDINETYFKNKMLEIYGSNANTNETNSIRVTATDAFGNTASLVHSININFIEIPIFNTKTFEIYHDYDINGMTQIDNLGVLVPTITNNSAINNSDLSIRMFNAGEGIILALPQATDLNNDITSYEIQLSRNDLGEIDSINLNPDSLTFGPWLNIDISTLQNIKDDNYYYYRYRASNYEKNEYFYFKVRAKDSKGNYSEEKISSTFIIGARTTIPVIDTGNVVINRITGSNYDQINLSYNLQIKDLGGSATTSGWSEDYYNIYPNFERSIANYTPMIQLLIEYSSEPTFSENYGTITKDYTGAFLDYSDTSATIESFPTNSSKVYIRFSIKVSYGLDSSTSNGLSTVSSGGYVVSYFGAVPTVAHRSHKVGINTTDLSSEDVLVVENYQNSKYIIFKGADPEDPTKICAITFDLSNGSVSGAIINGGSW